MEGSIRITKLADKTIITLRGLLDQELAFNLMGTANKTQPPIALNFKQVPYVTAAGSSAILNFYQLHKQKPEIQDPNPDIVSLFNLIGTSRYIELLPDQNEKKNTLQE